MSTDRKSYQTSNRPGYDSRNRHEQSRSGGNNSQAERGQIYVAIDLETTGVEADSGEIIEVAAIKFRLEAGGRTHILDRWQTFVKPANPIPYKITNLTGIRQSDVANAPTFEQIRERLRNFLGDYAIVGHSIDSDIGFLARQNFMVKNVGLDTYEMATLLMPQTPNYSLVGVAAALNVTAGGAHRAMADTIMAEEVFAALAAKIEELPPEILREIIRLSKDMDWPLRQLFVNASKNQEHHENAPGQNVFGQLLKQQLVEKGVASNDLDFMFLLPQEKPAPLQPNPAHSAIHPQDWSARTEQIGKNIWHAFEENQHLLLEATGEERERAEGMLLPALNLALKTGKGVVVAVNNEAERERIVTKIVPELQKTLTQIMNGGEESEPATNDRRSRRERNRRLQDSKPPFTVVSVKGMNSYLCLRRWEVFRQSQGLTPDETKFLIKLLVWLPNTLEGDSAELRILNQERLWSRVNTQRDLCLASHCEFNQRGQCFYFRAKDRAAGAHVVVANQAMILNDLRGEVGTLPQYDYLIVDDAHHLEDEASRQFGVSINPNTLFDCLDWLNRPITWKPEGGQDGFLQRIPNHFSPTVTPEVRDFFKDFCQQVAAQVELARNSTGVMLRDLTNILTQHNQESGQGDGRIRLNAAFRVGPLWSEVAAAWDVFKLDWEELYYQLRDLRDEVSAVKLQMLKNEALMLELDYFVNRTNDILNKLSAAFENNEPGQVWWLAVHQRTQLVSILSAPLQVGQTLERQLFEKKKAVALLSSTLTTDGEFSFVKDRLGLHQVTEVRLPPERDYPTTSMLYLPTDMPEPSQPGYQKSVEQQIINLAKASAGRTLVVFSSNSALRISYKAVGRPLEESNRLVLGLGLDGTRRSIMERFKNTPKSVLFSTLNYWEVSDFGSEEDEVGGLDINTLIITKLPFDPPSDPVFAARTEGRIFDDPFMQYSLPRTILRFKQAFERLLQVQPERGVVVMLDSRLTRKQYGPMFLNSLPPLHQRRGSLSEMVSEVSGWLKE